MFVLSAILTAAEPRLYVVPNEKHGDFYALCEGGNIVTVAVGDGFSSEAVDLAAFASEQRCTEIGDLVLTKYTNRQAYFVASVSSRIIVRRLRLPPPENEREWAIARRLVQEAELHGIEVSYDTDELCVARARDPWQWASNPPNHS